MSSPDPVFGQSMHKNNSEQKLETSKSAAMSEYRLCDYI